MKPSKLIALLGMIILILTVILPIGMIEDRIITLLPIYDNYNIDDIWFWRDISAFAVTYFIMNIIAFVFLLKENFKVLIAVSVVQLILFFFILVALWMTDMKIEENFGLQVFYYGFGIIFILLGILLLAVASALLMKEKLNQKQN